MFDNKGIHIYNSDLTNEDSTKLIPFDTTFTVASDNSKTTISQFSSADGGDVMVLVLDKMYFLTCEGTKEGEVDLSGEINGAHYSLVPYKKVGNELHYIISYVIDHEDYKNISIDYFKYNVNTGENERIYSKNFCTKVENRDINPSSLTGVSCIFLPNSHFSYEIFTCFYSVSFGIEIHAKSFDPENDFEELDDYSSYYYDESFTSAIAYISAVPNESKQRVFVYYLSLKPYWIIFEFDNKFSTPSTITYNSSNNILDHYYLNKVFYFRQTHEIICGFTTSQMTSKNLLVFNSDFTLKATKDITLNNCYNSFSYGIIFDGNSYNIVNDNANANTPIIYINTVTDLGTSEILEEPIILSEPTINIVDEKDKVTTHKEEPTINIIDEKDTTETIHKEEPTINIIINCDVEEFFNKNEKCQINITNTTQFKEIMTNKIRDDLKNGNLDDLISDVIDNNQDLLTKEKNVLYQITSSDNQNKNEYSNISTIQLGDCEEKLREVYHIDPQIPLLIFKIDNYEEGQLIPVIEYEVYEPINKTRLNLDECKGTKIEISIPVTIEEDSLYKYNLSSDYYNDKCCPTTSDNGTDITLNDRKIEFYNNNMSLCEDNCDFVGYNTNTKKAVCNCNVKTTISLSKPVIDKDQFFKNFVDLESIANFDVVKCYKLLFTKTIKDNIGNYIIAFIFFIHIVLLILFLVKGYQYFMSKVNKIILNEAKNRHDSTKKIRKKSINIPPKRKGTKRHTKNYGIEVYNKLNGEDSSTKNELFMKLVKEKNKIDLDKKDTNKYLKSSIKSNVHQNTKNDSKINNEPTNIELNDFEINSLSYINALEIDKRTFFQCYISIIKTKHIFIFAFFVYNDFNSSIIKICLFFFGFALYFTVNTLFFTDSTMHKIYEDGGVFNTFYQIPQILYSFFISAIINSIIKSLSLSEKEILNLKNNKNDRKKAIKKSFKCLVIKFIFFFIFCFIFLIAFWYYISCFCAVYVNTQKHLIKNTFICFFLSLLYPFLLHLIDTFLRIFSLKAKNRDKKCIYKISQFI